MSFIDKINPDVAEALIISDVHIHEHKPYILDKVRENVIGNLRYLKSRKLTFLQEQVNII